MKPPLCWQPVEQQLFSVGVVRDHKITGQWIRTIQQEAPEIQIFSFIPNIFHDDILKPKQDARLEMFAECVVVDKKKVS